MPGPLLAVDAPFVLYRSFYALPESIQGSVGRPVNALLGAANLLLRIAADRGPRAIVLCFGADAAAYRVELFPSYHADRPPVRSRWPGSSSAPRICSEPSDGASSPRPSSRQTTCWGRWVRSRRARAARR